MQRYNKGKYKHKKSDRITETANSECEVIGNDKDSELKNPFDETITHIQAINKKKTL